MKHFASPSFWTRYDNLPREIQTLADKNFELLKANPKHPSLHFKKAGKYFSARVGKKYRVVGVEMQQGILWFWIGTHAEYERVIQQ